VTAETTYLHDGNQVAVGRERPDNVVPEKRLEQFLPDMSDTER
jgi:hypothetical protein